MPCAALAARRAGAGVLLLDRADFPRDKPCGDGIAAHALDVLAGLGVPDPVAGYPPVPALRLVGAGRRRGGPPAAAGRRTRCPGGSSTPGWWPRRWRPVPSCAGTPYAGWSSAAGLVVLDGEIAAGVLIGADGAGSVVRRALGLPANPDGHLALAIRGYAPTGGGRPEQLIVTSRARWPAYAWSFPIGDGTANVGYGEVLRGEPLSRAHLLDRLAALLPGVDPGA